MDDAGDGYVGQRLDVTGDQGTRGMRNKNLLNIRYNAGNAWQGQVGSDGAFAVFQSYEMGIRAAVKLLQTYKQVHGLHTVRQIVSRWAPPGDGNNTGRYLEVIQQDVGLKPGDVVDTVDKAARLINAMAYVESRARVGMVGLRAAVRLYGVAAFSA